MRLTEISVRALPVPPSGQKTYFDDTLPNFGCRISQGGTRSFVVQHGLERQLITIGRYPIIPLGIARQRAKEILAERVLGKTRPQSVSCEEARALFLEACKQKNKPRTVAGYTRLLTRHCNFGRTQLADIRPADISRKLDRLCKVPAEQSHALTCIKIFMRWAQRRRYIEHSPCEGMQGIKGKPKTRVLSQDELTAVWMAAEKITYPFGRIVQLLILTGQRRSEIAQLKWCYFDNGTCTLPPEIVKNNRQHTFPIGDMTRIILDALPRFESPYVFPATRSQGCYNGWTKDTDQLRTLCGFNSWTLHDLRRTFATNLAALGTPIHITERLLNHVSGTQGGIVSVYQRHEYQDEMRAAVTLWENRISEILNKAL